MEHGHSPRPIMELATSTTRPIAGRRRVSPLVCGTHSGRNAAGWTLDPRRPPITPTNYYAAIRQTPASTIERCVNAITGKPTTKLKAVIERFTSKFEFLYDYLDCTKRLLMRLNQVMNRVKLASFYQPIRLSGWLPRSSGLGRITTSPVADTSG